MMLYNKIIRYTVFAWFITPCVRNRDRVIGVCVCVDTKSYLSFHGLAANETVVVK